MTQFHLPHDAMLTAYQNADLLAAAAAQRVAEIIHQTNATKGQCRIALAGGETPRRCYEHLRNAHVDWSHVHIYFGDERCLQVGDAQRNDTMAYNSLLRHISIPEMNIHAIPGELGAQVAASRYSLEIEQVMPFDLVMLGMGEDGHTASLFPNNQALRSDGSVVAVFDAPKLPTDRVSLSMKTLNAALHKLFLVAGVGKRVALQQISQGVLLPAGQVNNAEWYVNQDALPE